VKCIDDEIPFEIPATWIWVRLNDICSYIQRGKSPIYSSIKKYPVIAQKCNQWAGFCIDKAQFIDPHSLSSYSEERLLQDGDLMWNSTGLGTLGRMAIYQSALNPYELAVADSHVTVIRPLKAHVLSQYLYYYFASDTVQSVIEDKSDGSTKQKELSTTTVKNYMVPLPSLAEQERIVEKVRVIMPVIDKYSKSQEHLNKINTELNESLKKSILQEAIQGKLVPQIAEEGTAQELLEQIRQEKLQLVKEGKLKKSALTDSVIFKGDDNKYYEQIGSEVSEIELPFEIPSSWSLARLNAVCQLTDGLKATGKQCLLDAKYLRGKSSGTIVEQGKLVYKGDNIVLVDGENSGEVFIVPQDGYMGSTFKQLWISSSMYEPYILAFIQFYKETLRNSKKGAAIPHLNKELFYGLIIGIPPLQEQRRVVQKIEQSSKLFK
jgi:type I restriction enzyme S subunit